MDLPNTFNVTNVGNSQIVIDEPCTEARLTQMYIKEDGAIGDTPSFAFVGMDKLGNKYLMQLSAQMFRVAYEDMKAIYEEEKMSAEADEQVKEAFKKWMVGKTPEEIAEGVVKYGNDVYDRTRKATLDDKLSNAMIKTIFEPPRL